jgi:hypothetical protein
MTENADPPAAAVASIMCLERAWPTIQDRTGLVEKDPDQSRILVNFQERTSHLRKLLHDVIFRLRLDKGTKPPVSVAARQHGDPRHRQGYTVAMVLDEP